VPVQHSAVLPAAPERVLDVRTQEEFLRACAAELGVRVDDVDVRREDGGVRTTLELRASTVGIPAAFRRFLGSDVAVVDGRAWTPDGDGGYVAAVEVRAEIFGRAAVVRGRQALIPVPEGTAVTTTADVSVDAPVMGRQAEAAVRQLVSIVLRREADLIGAACGQTEPALPG
jgi:hypothetical protein